MHSLLANQILARLDLTIAIVQVGTVLGILHADDNENERTWAKL